MGISIGRDTAQNLNAGEMRPWAEQVLSKHIDHTPRPYGFAHRMKPCAAPEDSGARLLTGNDSPQGM